MPPSEICSARFVQFPPTELADAFKHGVANRVPGTIPNEDRLVHEPPNLVEDRLGRKELASADMLNGLEVEAAREHR